MLIGFVGLGQMGKHMAINMLKSGAELIVNDVKTDSFPVFNAKGARTATDLADIAQGEIIFLSLPDGNIVKNVIFGEQGVFPLLKKGQIIVDLSTSKYNITLEIATRLAEAGVGFVDAPVSGMEARAMDGTLTVMCGGEIEIFDKVKPYLECIGNNILYMGKSGNGQFAKLINQLLFNINMAALAEILPMSVKLGLDPENVAQIVNSGTGKSYASDFFIPRILKDSFTEGYPMQSAYKDLVSAAELGAKLGIPMPVLAAATGTYQAALLKGLGHLDKGAMICVFEDLLGVKYRGK